MFKPVAASSSSSSSMVQTLSSLLQRVQLFGPEDCPLPLDSPVMSPKEHQYRNSKNNVSSASSKPIPYTAGYLNYNHSDGSLDSIPYDNSLDSSSQYNNSVCSQDFNIDTEVSYSTYEENEYSDKSEEEEEDELEEIVDDRTKTAVKSLQEVSLCEVAQHDMFHDCWIVFYDKVYDVTSFLLEHPGGEELLMEHAGRDGTMAFRSVGHSKAALASLQDYIIGILPPHERIFNDWETN